MISCRTALVKISDASLSTASSSTDTSLANNLGNESSDEKPFLGFAHDEMQTMSQRLRTFTVWPKPEIIHPEKLAQAGFYFTQKLDAVKCAFCGCVIMFWTANTDVDKAHKEFLPKCTFRLCKPNDDTLNLNNVVIRPGTTKDYIQLGIQPHSAPKAAKYASYEVRLATFSNWPETLKQTPEKLAGAGFYCEGFGDHVRCFSCDGGLRNWEPTDDAWTEHARWFPKCEYVNLVKGQKFVKQCIDNRPPLDPSIFEGVPDDDIEDVMETVPSRSRFSLNDSSSISDEIMRVILEGREALACGLHVDDIKRSVLRRMEEMGIARENVMQLIKQTCSTSRFVEYSQLDGKQIPDALLLKLLNSSECDRKERDDLPAAQSTASEPSDPSSKNDETQKMDYCATANEKAHSELDKRSDYLMLLEEENRTLKEARLCKICMDWEASVVFLPCGHLTTCVYCAPSFTHCPMCRQVIHSVVRTFVS